MLSKAGYSVITYDSNYDGETEKKYVRMMRNNLVDGLIIAGLSDTQNKAFYTQLTQEDPQRVPHRESGERHERYRHRFRIHR